MKPAMPKLTMQRLPKKITAPWTLSEQFGAISMHCCAESTGWTPPCPPQPARAKVDRRKRTRILANKTAERPLCGMSRSPGSRGREQCRSALALDLGLAGCTVGDQGQGFHGEQPLECGHVLRGPLEMRID